MGLFLRVVHGQAVGENHKGSDSTPLSPLSIQLPECVRSSFASTLNVCAYVILFSILTALADCSGLLPRLTQALATLLPLEQADTLCRSFLVGLLELSTGTSALGDAVVSPAALPLAAFILGWGGLSVHCQSLPFWRKAQVTPGPYLRAKLLQGLLSAVLTAAGATLFPLTLPVMAPAVVTLAAPELLGQEILALWALSGAYFFYSLPQKGRKKSKKGLY